MQHFLTIKFGTGISKNTQKKQKATKHKTKYDCIVFCHGNSGNRCSIFECLNIILESNFVAVSFDFTGFKYKCKFTLIYIIKSCGNSEGEYITLGYFEKYDL